MTSREEDRCAVDVCKGGRNKLAGNKSVVQALHPNPAVALPALQVLPHLQETEGMSEFRQLFSNHVPALHDP